jgi:hypothetical protein
LKAHRLPGPGNTTVTKAATVRDLNSVQPLNSNIRSVAIFSLKRTRKVSSSGIGNNSVVCLIAKRLWEGLRFDDESWPLCTLPRFRFRLIFLVRYA